MGMKNYIKYFGDEFCTNNEGEGIFYRDRSGNLVQIVGCCQYKYRSDNQFKARLRKMGYNIEWPNRVRNITKTRRM